MSMASTQNPPHGEALPRPPFLEMAGTRHRPALRVHPVPALNLPQRQRRGLIPAWGHRPRNNTPINDQGPTARSMFPPRTTTGRAANPRPAAHFLECGDKSPLWHSLTCHRVPQRGPARALQNDPALTHFSICPKPSAYPSPQPVPKARPAAHVNPGQITGRGLGSQMKPKIKRPLPAGLLTFGVLPKKVPIVRTLARLIFNLVDDLFTATVKKILHYH